MFLICNSKMFFTASKTSKCNTFVYFAKGDVLITSRTSWHVHVFAIRQFCDQYFTLTIGNRIWQLRNEPKCKNAALLVDYYVMEYRHVNGFLYLTSYFFFDTNKIKIQWPHVNKYWRQTQEWMLNRYERINSTL